MIKAYKGLRCGKARNDVKHTPRHQKLCQKVHHDVKTYTMTTKTMSKGQKVCHDDKKYAMVTKNTSL